MTRLNTFVIGSTLALAMTASPAAAEQVDVGKHTPEEIKSICEREGGDYIRGGNVWSCFKKCAGGTCSVSCDKDGCTGTTPARRAPAVVGERAVLDALNGKVETKQRHDERSFPWGLLGLLGLAGLLAFRRPANPVAANAPRGGGR